MLQYKSLEKSIKRIEKSWSFYQSDLAQSDVALREEFRSAVIHSFETAYELACKMIRRQLREIEPNPSELDALAFADLLRRAAKVQLIPDVKRFLDYRDHRNETVHVYEENVAASVVEVIPDFIQDANHLLHELQKRNR